jgi:hypothetical protein
LQIVYLQLKRLHPFEIYNDLQSEICNLKSELRNPMTAKDFREIALTLPETVEHAHMGHPDFRVGGKVFATLGYPNKFHGMVKLSPEQQHYFSQEHPDIFTPLKGTWGRRGATSVKLKAAKKSVLNKAIGAAWRNTAPKRLVAGQVGYSGAH